MWVLQVQVQPKKIEQEEERHNFALAKDGAKIVAANKEARKPESVLDSDGDTFLKNECKADKWLIIELSQVTMVDMVRLSQVLINTTSPASGNPAQHLCNPCLMPEQSPSRQIGASQQGAAFAWHCIELDGQHHRLSGKTARVQFCACALHLSRAVDALSV